MSGAETAIGDGGPVMLPRSKSLETDELAAALSEIEHAAREFIDLPDSSPSSPHLLETLRRCCGKLNEPYGFDSNTDALRLRIWRDCVTIMSNLELAASPTAGNPRALIKAQLQQLSTLIEGMLDLMGDMADKR